MESDVSEDAAEGVVGMELDEGETVTPPVLDVVLVEYFNVARICW